MKKHLEKILKLSVEERILIVEELWDSIADDSSKDIPVPESHKAELDKRLEKEKKGTAEYSSWSDVKRRIQSRL